MQLSRTIFALFFLVGSLSTLTQAQLFEDFEAGDKSSYAGASRALESGSWFLEDALLGSGSGDLIRGSQAVRLRDGFLRMDFNKADGADEISFYSGNSSFSNDGGGKIQVYYSTDSGSIWNVIGDEITLTNELANYIIPVAIEGNIRFRINRTAGGRLNIDDLLITDFVVAQDSATLAVTVDASSVEENDVLSFTKTLVGTKRTKTIQLKNVGNTTLSISNVIVSGEGFTLTSLSKDSLEFNESTELTLTFEPTQAGVSQGSIVINSNSENDSELNLVLSGEGFEDGDIISIADARTLPLGTRVSISGRVTVANEFGGPLYMQDATAGMAVFWEPLHSTVSIGDSVSVTGPLTVFKPIVGDDSDFLLQISDTDTDSDVIFELFDVEARFVSPRPVNIEQVNSGNYEAQLIVIQNVTIDHSGVFQANTNYTITDNSGSAELRVDNNTNLVGAQSPEDELNIVAAIGKFAGVYQILPRFTEDLGVESVVFPGDDISKDLTLDIVTWNIEWFGDSGNGPVDDNVQFENAKTLITTMDADIYAFQEISNTTLFNALDQDLEGYSGVVASFSQSQKTAFLYKDATIQMNSSQLITAGMVQSDWANGRYPFELQFSATINGETQDFYAYNLHAKAFGEQSDYSQRLNASSQLKNYLDNTHQAKNVIVLGDFNDEIVQSTSSGNPDSPYKNFDDDVKYTIVTKNLEEKGYTSYSRFSMIDHIVFSSELSDEYFVGTERVENPFYIGNFLSETSDHFPVWVRFNMGLPTSNEEEPNGTVSKIRLDQNYPNPFNPSTAISYSLDKTSEVSLEVYDLMGRKVATLVNGKQNAGEQKINFDASNLSSGIYIYRLKAGSQLLTKKMILLK